MPPPPHDDPPRRLGRRSVLGLVAGLGAVAAGCRPVTVQPRTVAPTAHPRAARPDPDVALAAAALAEEQHLLDLVHAVRRRHPSLAAGLGDTARTHQRHVALLTSAVPAKSRPAGSAAAASRRPAVPAAPGQALALVVRREQHLARTERHTALAAASGDFARILASMAAAAAQQAVVLGGRVLAAEDAG